MKICLWTISISIRMSIVPERFFIKLTYGMVPWCKNCMITSYIVPQMVIMYCLCLCCTLPSLCREIVQPRCSNWFRSLGFLGGPCFTLNFMHTSKIRDPTCVPQRRELLWDEVWALAPVPVSCPGPAGSSLGGLRRLSWASSLLPCIVCLS